jgi:hypothetical protein
MRHSWHGSQLIKRWLPAPYTCAFPHLALHIFFLSETKETNPDQIFGECQTSLAAAMDDPRTRGCFYKPPPPLVRHFPSHPFVSAPSFSSWTIRETVLYTIIVGKDFQLQAVLIASRETDWIQWHQLMRSVYSGTRPQRERNVKGKRTTYDVWLLNRLVSRQYFISGITVSTCYPLQTTNNSHLEVPYKPFSPRKPPLKYLVTVL